MNRQFYFVKICCLSLLLVVSAPLAESYSRYDFSYTSYKPNTSLGFYTKKLCKVINVDHVVSLKDAYESGAATWSQDRKSKFANDRNNHVPSCAGVNSSKGSVGPKVFLSRSRDGKGLEYEIVSFCEYVQKYHNVKLEYGLSFTENDKPTFQSCGLIV